MPFATNVLYFPAIMHLQTVHVLLGEELNKPSFRSGPNNM